MSENREQICRVLTEEILGKTYHTVTLGGYEAVSRCSCGEQGHIARFECGKNNRDFSDRNQLGELYDKIQEMKEWEGYVQFAFSICPSKLEFIAWLFRAARAFDTVYPWWMGRKK